MRFTTYLGYTGGLFTYAGIQKKLELLIPLAIVFAVLGWLGSGADFLGLLREWYKELKEEESTPTLEYDDIIVLTHDRREVGKDVYDRTYLLGISKTKGIGTVERCEALLSLEGFSHLRNIISPWLPDENRYEDIREIELFTVTDFYEGTKEVIFPPLYSNKTYSTEKSTILFDDIKGRKLTIRLGAKNGNLPNVPFVNTIEDIEKKAVSK
ncbi:MAG: hypothetical protein WAM14_16600 [Candidatus Nitrosopolaris sp.]